MFAKETSEEIVELEQDGIDRGNRTTDENK